MKEINLACQKDVIYIITGNKVDLLQRESSTEAMEFARSINGYYIETSAKTGANVPELVNLVARSIILLLIKFCFFILFIELVESHQSHSPSSYDGSYQFCDSQLYSTATSLIPEEEQKKKCCC